MNRIADIMAAIVTVALVATVVQSRYTAGVIAAFGGAFSNSIKAARGT